MPVLLWLSLLLGYVVGVAGALFLLPAPVVEPLIGRIVIASVVVMTGTVLFLVLQRRRVGLPLVGEAIAAAFARQAGTPSAPGGGSADAKEAGGRSDGAKQAGGRSDDVVGDPERLEALNARRADPLARAPDGALGPRELRQLLYDGRVEILARPVIALPTREQAFLKITPRLLDQREEVVPAANFRRSLARCGLEPVFDRVQVIRALQSADAGRSGEVIPLIACSIDLRSLASPVLLDGLEEFFRDHPGRGERLVLEFDRVPRDAAARQATRRLLRHGVRLGLERLSAAPLDLERIAEIGCQFVRLAAPRFAVLPGAAAGALPSLGALLASAEQAGLTVVVDQAESLPTPLLEGGRIDTPLPSHPAGEVKDDAA